MKKFALPLLSLCALFLFSCKTETPTEVVEEVIEEAVEIQVLEPVQWSYTVEELGDMKYKLIFDATIDDGWYLYSSTIAEDGPIPTSVNFDESESLGEIGALEESGVETKDGYDEMFDMDIKKFGHGATFTQVVSAKAAGTITGYLEYMTCDSVQCLFPDPIEFVIDVK